MYILFFGPYYSKHALIRESMVLNKAQNIPL